MGALMPMDARLTIVDDLFENMDEITKQTFLNAISKTLLLACFNEEERLEILSGTFEQRIAKLKEAAKDLTNVRRPVHVNREQWRALGELFARQAQFCIENSVALFQIAEEASPH